MTQAPGRGCPPRRRLRLAAGLSLTVALLAAGACGGIRAEDWQTAIAGADRVETLIREGHYAEARALWQKVDPVIHRVYPLLQPRDPDLAGRLWHEMAVVELGFLGGSWKSAADAAHELPELLRRARAELAGTGGG